VEKPGKDRDNEAIERKAIKKIERIKIVEKLSKNGIDEAKRGKFYKKKKY
jgi:hypothetical protein